MQKNNLPKELPESVRIVYRFVRVAFVTALAQTFIDVCGSVFSIDNVFKCAPDKLNDPRQLATTVAISLVSGFLIALGMKIRDLKGDKSFISKVMPF